VTKAYRPIEYCWVVGEIWCWNRPATLGFDHVLSLQVELQDGKRNKVAQETHDVVLLTTSHRVTVMEMQDIRSDAAVLARIGREIAGLKERYAGY
jgi:hypothetical protein